MKRRVKWTDGFEVEAEGGDLECPHDHTDARGHGTETFFETCLDCGAKLTITIPTQPGPDSLAAAEGRNEPSEE